nr:transposase [Sinorhizobium medicae]
MAVVHGLKGFPEAINAVFPQTIVQTCIVHLIRHSLEFVSWKAARQLCRRCAPSTGLRTPKPA